MNPAVLDNLRTICAAKHWQSNCMDKFCVMLENLTQEQQELIIELTSQYLKIGMDKYIGHLQRALDSIPCSFLPNKSEVYVMLLVDEREKERVHTKSATLALQTLKSVDFIVPRGLSFIPLVPYEIPNNFRKSKKIMLLDDFLGTGNTARNMINSISSSCGIDISSFFILTLVAQEEGVGLLRQMGVSVFSAEFRKKGISDYFPDAIKDKKLEIMQAISNKIMANEMPLGYGQSEALVTTNTTPNNTFPIFWYQPRINGKKLVAPFPRHSKWKIE